MDQEPTLSQPQHPSPSAPPPAGEAPPYYPPPPYAPYGMPPPRKRPFLWRLFISVLKTVLVFFVIMFILSLVLTYMDGKALIGFGGDGIGLLRIEDEIFQGESQDFWMDTLGQFARQPNIKGVLVRIDSPGGSVGASQELAQAILKIRQQHRKQVYVSMGDIGASGGYYAASAADRIYGLKGTLTASIGVLFSKPDVSTLTQKLGIRTETVKSGSLKDAGDFMRPLTPYEREFFTALIMNTYDQFIADVLANRREPLERALKSFRADQWQAYHLSPSAEATPETYLRQIADGRVVTGEQALRLGLIDEIGTLDDVKAALGRRTGLGSTPEIYEFSHRKSWSHFLQNRVSRFLPASRPPLQYMMHLP